jgi:predicted dehydrogenase
MGDRVAWGILGTGKIARILAQAIAASTGGRLAAVGSRDVERSKAFAAEFDAPGAGTYEEVLADDAVELVYVATHHPEHRAWAVAAADAGKHVLCEKPLAVRRPDAEAIVEAARRSDVFLMEAFAYRSHPQTARMLELVRGGAIGSVRVIDAAFGYDAGPEPTNYLMDPALAGGSILDVGCYTTSMVHRIVAVASGVDVVPAAAAVEAAAVFGPTGVDHSTAATLTFEGGILARVACSIQANLESSVRIVGSDGWIELPTPWLPGRIGGDARILVGPPWGEGEALAIEEPREVYTVEVDAVSAHVRDGVRSSPTMSWEESLANMLTLDRWRAAIGLRYAGDPDG